MKILSTPSFDREAKRLSKKFPSLKEELSELKQALMEKPELGIPLGKNCYKIRLAVKSKGRGKSGGMRVITWVVYEIQSNIVLFVNLLSLYDKSERSSISLKELTALINESKQDLLLEKFGKN